MKSGQSARADLDGIAAQLSNAMVFIEVAVCSLDAHEGRGGPELPVLEHALSQLRHVHTALDRAATCARG